MYDPSDYFKILNGHWRDEDWRMTPGKLTVQEFGGDWYRVRFGYEQEPIKAVRHAVAKGITCIEIDCGGGLAFCPDEGQCELAGMPVGEPGDAP